MSRFLLDDGLRSWEAFASTGPYGYSDGSRPRACAVTGDNSAAEAKVKGAPASELLEMLGRAAPLS